MKTDIVTYLNKHINKAENLNELLNLFLLETQCTFGAIFLYIQNNKYILIESTNNSVITYEPTSKIENIIISNNGNTDLVCKKINIKNSMIIPILSHTIVLGIICLINRNTDFYEELISEISPYISITQLILNNKKILEEYKRVYEDVNYFSKDLFLANMSHEIRTPLNGIIGYNQLLMKTNLSITQQNYLTSMNQCSIQLLSIINDIIDFSKLSTGKMPVQNECFSIKEIIDIIRDIIGKRLDEKRQTIKYNISPDVHDFVVSDKQKVVQILVNLISNASKFSDIGKSINININSDTKQDIIIIDVVDQGKGIIEQDQYKLFNSFTQLENSCTKTGTGLGLAISKRLVELLGGHITVKSEFGHGSTFTFTFKYNPYKDYEKKISKGKKILKDKYVLVVDDNIDNRIVMSEILYEWKMIPIICASGIEALSMITNNRYSFSLALIDICMPGITGTELAKQIKNERPLLSLVALSSIDTFVNTTEFERKLDKPINKLQLYDTIIKIIEKNEKAFSFFLGSTEEEDENDSTSSFGSFSDLNKDIKILVVDDIIFNKNLLINMLEYLGYSKIDSADNGEQAVEKIKKESIPYDIVLLDLRMPIMDGYEVIESLIKANIVLPKIVIITASVLQNDKSKCKDKGIKYFINKPIELNELKEVMLHISTHN